MADHSGPRGRSPAYLDTLYHPVAQTHREFMVKRKPIMPSVNIPDGSDDEVGEHGKRSTFVSSVPMPAGVKREYSDGSTRPSPRSFLQRVGQIAIWAFVAGTAIIIAIIAFLAFLWFGSSDNTIRRRFLLDAWLTRTVTICSLALRSIIDLQLALTTAMIAALILEVTGVRLPDAAQSSMIRAQPSSNKIFNIVLMHMRFPDCFHRRAVAVTILVICVTCVSILSQLTSFALISDIGITDIISFTNSSLSPYNFRINGDQPLDAAQYDTSWIRKPNFYPAFAEYSEPAPAQDGVIDTGLTLRALLPYSTQSSREVVSSFSGITKVLDSRVSCQAPVLDDPKVLPIDELWAVQLTGTVRPSRNASRLDDRSMVSVGETKNGSEIVVQTEASGVAFSCLTFDRDFRVIEYDPQWKLTLCQLSPVLWSPAAGTLVSEFVTLEDYYPGTIGTQFLLLNFTAGLYEWWIAARDMYLMDGSQQMTTPTSPNETTVRGEWLDLTHYLYGSNTSSTISVSLCYSALNMSVLNVDVEGDMTRTEPQPTYDNNKYAYYFDAVRKQFGQGNLTPDERGILSLKKKDSWLPSSFNNTLPIDYSEDYTMRQATDMAGSYNGNTGNWTAMLWSAATEKTQSEMNGTYYYVVPHTLHVTLFQRIIQQGGTIAFALQSLLTSLASMDYYDQLPTYNETAPAQQSFFVLANVPLRRHGFSAVCTVVFAHLIVCCIVTILFARMTSWSDLGNDWQSVSQLLGAETRDVLPAASYSSSTDIFNNFKSADRHKTVVIARYKRAENVVGLERKD